MPIKTRPDKLKKKDMFAAEKAKIDQRAGNFGQAAGLLSDPEKVILHQKIIQEQFVLI